MNAYVDETEEMKDIAIETIAESINDCQDNTDIETALHNIMNLNLYNLEEKEILDTKKKLLKYVNIPKLQEKVRQAILNLSRNEETGYKTSKLYIETLDTRTKLDLIYEIMDKFEIFKSQTSNLSKYKSSSNNDNQYILNYLLTAQEILKTIYEYSEYKPSEPQVQQQIKENNLKLLVFNR